MTCINFPCEWASDELEYIPSSSTDDVFTPFLYPFEDNNLGNIVDTPPRKSSMNESMYFLLKLWIFQPVMLVNSGVYLNES